MIRIVKMTFRKEEVETFLSIFKKNKDAISSFDGCKSVTLLQDKNSSNIFFTYSHWEQESFLEKYRESELFQKVWTQVKPLFAEKAEAWSVETVE